MSGVVVPLRLGIPLSFKAIRHVLLKPSYLGVGLLTFIIVAGLFAWLGNIQLLLIILGLNAPPGEKLAVFVGGYQSIFISYQPLAAAIIVVFCILFAINTTLLAFVLVGQSQALRSGGTGAVGLLAGIIGAGCAACGTSIITPLAAGVGAAASTTLTEYIGLVANLAGSMLLVFSIYRLGLNAADILVRQRQKNYAG